MDLEDTLSVKDACAYLHVSSKTIYRWIESGKLPAQKVGLQYFIKRDMVEAVASGRGVYIDNIVQRLETIEQRLTAIEQRLDALTRPQPREQPPAEAVAPVRAALASLMKLTPAQDEPVRLNQFADIHGIARNEAERLWKVGFIAGKREPSQGRRRGSVIIDAAGMHDFWVQFHDHAEFRKCDSCPH